MKYVSVTHQVLVSREKKECWDQRKTRRLVLRKILWGQHEGQMSIETRWLGAQRKGGHKLPDKI